MKPEGHKKIIFSTGPRPLIVQAPSDAWRRGHGNDFEAPGRAIFGRSKAQEGGGAGHKTKAEVDTSEKAARRKHRGERELIEEEK